MNEVAANPFFRRFQQRQGGNAVAQSDQQQRRRRGSGRDDDVAHELPSRPDRRAMIASRMPGARPTPGGFGGLYLLRSGSDVSGPEHSSCRASEYVRLAKCTASGRSAQWRRGSKPAAKSRPIQAAHPVPHPLPPAAVSKRLEDPRDICKEIRALVASGHPRRLIPSTLP